MKTSPEGEKDSKINPHVKPQDWKTFQDSGLLWFTNRLLHIFGWAIVFVTDQGVITNVYPARVSYRGFSEETEDKGFQNLTEFVAKNIRDLKAEVRG